MRVERSTSAAFLTAIFLGAVSVTSVPGFAQNAPGRGRATDPTVSWTCPMHPEELEDKKGTCRICKMDLVPIRLESIWSCPVHAVVAQTKPGKCPIDHTRDLVQVTVAVSWTCPEHPEIDQFNPGKCPDGSAMVIKRTPRPHGNHNPQHGGLFFMAPDNWHHVEGSYSANGVVRMYLYDDYAKVLPSDKVRLARARIVTKETFDSVTRVSRELTAYPLTPVAQDGYLEAHVGPLSLPAQMTTKIKFNADGPEYRFDFTFSEFSKEAPSSAQLAPTPVRVRPVTAAGGF